MKRGLKTIALLAIFAGAFMSSCTEDEYSVENSSELGCNYKTTVSPNNNLNPNDSIGVLHNIHLDSIISILCENYTNPDAIHQDTLNRIVRDYFLNIYDKDIVEAVFDDESNTLDDEKSLDLVLTELNFSEDAKEIVFSLFNRVEEMENNGYMPYYDTICNVERNIISNKSFTATETQILLSFTSVLRHSLYYWYEENTLAKSTPDWILIAGADAAGALTGAKTGAEVGMILGQAAGATIGTAVGAVAGAAGASATMALELRKLKEKGKDKENQEKPKE